MSEHDQANSQRRFRFKDCEFDASTGQLTKLDHGEQESSTLAPQPARLLALLLESPGQLVTHDTIRETLWPDNAVEYDQGVHFCIRQIRAALGDNASKPEFIQTLPRRGYSWITSVEILGETDGTTTDDSNPHRRRVIIMAVIITVGVLIWGILAQLLAPPPVRIAMLPFDPPAETTSDWTTAALSNILLSELAYTPELQVIGPTTTDEYMDAPNPIRRLIDELDLQYLLNARFRDEPDEQRVLIELIRSSDGAHVWVRWIEYDADPDDAANGILDGIIPILLEPDAAQ